MPENPLFVILPIIIVTLTIVSVLLLYLWWTSNEEEETSDDLLQQMDLSPEEDERAPTRAQQPARPEMPEGDELTVGQVFDDLREGVAGVFSNIRAGREARRSLQNPAEPPTSSGSTLPASSPPPSTVTPMAPSPPTQSGFQAPTRPAASSTGDLVEVMRLMRDLADGSLIVEINGRRYRALSDVADMQVRRRFIGNAQALAEFARLDENGDLPDLPPEELTAISGEAQDLPDADEPDWLSVPVPAAPPPDAFIDPAVEAERGFVEQIEALLQLRLGGSPTLRTRSIHIRRAPGGGIRVEVDGRYFEGVGDVDDPEARAFIQSVIQEWESRQ